MKRIFKYFRANHFDQDLDDELKAHLEERIDELVENGMNLDAARADALRQFGNRARVAEMCHEAWSLGPLDEIFHDLKYAIRVLRRNPVFATVSILSLALGIGINVTIFGAVNQVLLRALPYPRAGDLFAVWGRSINHGVEPMHVSAADFYDWRNQSRAFESLSAYSSWPMNLTDVDEPRRLEAQLVSANLFSTLDVKAEIGRAFQPDEDQEQSPPVVALSHHLWRELGGSDQIIGRQITLNGSPATVVGVMPAGFAFPDPETDAWTPLTLSAKNRSNRDGRWLSVIGRLRSGASMRDVNTEMDVIAKRLAATYPVSNNGWSVALVPLQEELVGKTRPILITLQIAALILLLITCANLANLLFARGAARTREVAVRAALGASRLRILRQLLAESLLLAAIGGALGFVLATPCLQFVKRFGNGLIPRANELHMDLSVGLFATGATLITVLIFGLLPALHSSRNDIGKGVGSGTRGTPRHIERKRGFLIILEIGLAFVLLVGAGLLSESMIRLQSTSTGLHPDHLLTLRITLSHSRYSTIAAQNTFFDQILSGIRILPGVLGAGEISDTPLKGNNPTFEFALDGLIHRSADPPVQAGLRLISTGYLQTAGIPLLQGRDFTSGDRVGAVPVAIINQAMARRYWPGSDPIGRRLRVKDEPQWITIAGLVPDVKHMGLKEEEGPVVYIPYAQKTQDWLAWTTLVIRTSGEPTSFVPAVRSVIRDLDRSQPVSEIGTLEEVLTKATAVPRFSASISNVMAGVALLIAVIGVYGLLSYTIAQRLSELSIRLALGASPVNVSLLLIRQSMLRVFAGVAVGLPTAWVLARYSQSLLFGIQPHDPYIFVGVPLVLVTASFVAVLAPAIRVFKINPASALRAE
jgi:putative ABC transport system permease protein